MLSKFLKAVRITTNQARTENDAKSYASSLSAVLDFFSKGSALRGKNKQLQKYFSAAMTDQKSLSLKALFYMRDIRGGQGERESFRYLLKYLSSVYRDDLIRLLPLIPKYGRWDDLLVLLDSSVKDDVLSLIRNQWSKDADNLSQGQPLSLLAKWLPSENASSDKSKKLSKLIRNALGLNSKAYRQSLSALRRQIDIVERRMSLSDWTGIAYAKLPSQAMKLYRKAFKRQDQTRFLSYLKDVEDGKARINAQTLYPYQIVNAVSKTWDSDEIRTLDALWKGLPNYMDETEGFSMAVVDVSGSMTSGINKWVKPIDVSISLGIYFAERAIGPFKDHFITFSGRPKMQKVEGYTIRDKVDNLSQADWEMNTDLQRVFKLILRVARQEKLGQDEIPAKLYIISDMQFDQAVQGGRSMTNLDAITCRYDKAGFRMPQLVFWNVNARSDQPATMTDEGILMVSGLSPSILHYAMNCKAITPYELMLEVLDSDRYKEIV